MRGLQTVCVLSGGEMLVIFEMIFPSWTRTVVGNKPVGLTAAIITCPQHRQSPVEVLYSAHIHTHTHTHTHRSPFHTQKKNSNPTSSMSSPPTRHSALNGLKVSVQPSVVQTLNARAFLTYHRSLTSSIHMVVIGLNNLSGWVNKVFTLLSAVERLNRHFCTRRHKQTGKARENEEMQKEQPVN